MGGKKLKESDLIDDDAFVPKVRPQKHETEEYRLRIRAIRSLDGFGFDNG